MTDDHAYRTKAGRQLTDRAIEEYAAEAERGYDLDELTTVTPERREELKRHVREAESFEIQRGERPATTIHQLVDAQRQNFAGAGADLYTLNHLLFGETAAADEAVADVLRRLASSGADRRLYELASRLDRAKAAFDRLDRHLREADRKATLAFEEESG